MRKNFIRYILSCLTSFVFSLPGVAIAAAGKSSLPLILLLSVSIVIPPILGAIQVFSSLAFSKKYSRMSITEGRKFLLSHRDEAELTAKKKQDDLFRIRRSTVAYSALLFAFAVISSIAGGLVYSTGFATLIILYSGLVFYAVYARIHKQQKIVLNEQAFVLDPKDYPSVYAVAHRASDALGCKKEIVILLSADCNATVAQDRDHVYIQMGIRLLHVMSKSELYSALLHEFSHVAEKNSRSQSVSLYYDFICNQGERYTGVFSILPYLFVAFDTRYSFHHMLYMYANSVVAEADADSDMAKHGDLCATASMLRKLQYDNLYSWEDGAKDFDPIYAPDAPIDNFLTKQINEFRSAIKERHEFWDELIEREILANNATHPTLKMRLAALGASGLGLVEDDSSDEYRAEVQKALDGFEASIYKDVKKSYENDRKERYLDPLKRISEWKEDQMTISAESYADIIEAFKVLGRIDEALELCDRVIAELGDESSAHAYFVKGYTLLCRYDPKGMECLYHAIENNKNYLEEGLNYMGMFCCITGRETELAEYREFAARMTQTNVDENSKANFLARGDKLSADTMPDEMRDEILAFIRSTDSDGIIENVYLVRKTISESFFTSAFVIHFYGGTDAQRNEIMHNIFRYLDSYPVKWQFSLFDYFECLEVKVDKIPGTLVYSKSNGKKG